MTNPKTDTADAPDQLTSSDCSICRHPDAAAIDEALLGGTTIRTVAGTHNLSRSAVGRHRQNHLSAEAVTAEDEDRPARTGVAILDVHSKLAALVDRLEAVVELATRTRKAPAAVAAMRELRQTLEAIGRIQGDPTLRQAATAEAVKATIDQQTGELIAKIINWALGQFGKQYEGGWSASVDQTAGEPARIMARLISDCLRSMVPDGSGVRIQFSEVDTSEVRAYVERQALERARVIDDEVKRRVEAELRRRENQERPAIEQRQPLAIEGGAPLWSA